MSAVIDRLSREDAQILALGGATIRGHTAKVMVLEPVDGVPLPGVEQIRDRVAARLDRAPRFRRRVVPTPFGVAAPVWADDPEFAIERHVAVLDRGDAVGVDGLTALAAERMSDMLDRAHPLWHLDVIPRLADGRMALIWRVHHALADGTGCVRIARAILWDTPDSGPPTIDTVGGWRPEPAPGRLALLSSGVAGRVGDRLGSMRHTAPPRSVRSLPELREVLRREIRRDATLTPLAGHAGHRRAVAFASLSFAACHTAGKAIAPEVTVNDVLLAVVAGALREWMPDRVGPEATIRVKVPVSLHGAAGDDGQANHDSYFFADLPIHEPDPVERVRIVSRETTERKLHHDAEALYHLGLHPTFVRVAMSPRVFTFNVSNVPGPRDEVSMLGARVAELYSLAEIAEHHTLRMAIISLAGRLFFGLNADAGAVPELPALAAGIERSGAELIAAVG